MGWCPQCTGTGRVGINADEDQALADDNEAVSAAVCPACHGTRLNPVALAVKFEGRSIGETTAMSVDEALKARDQMEWVRRMNSIRNRAEEIVKTELIFV